MEKPLLSYHIFLFPFQWEFIGKMMKNKTIEQRTKLEEFVSLFDSDKWVRKEYTLDKVLNYNEFNFYYPMVRDVLFDTGSEIDRAIITNLFYKIEPDEYLYEFKVCVEPKNGIVKTYRLHIESIIMHLYSTGVGVLSFHLNNRFADQGDQQDILNINQAGRRIYPPFFPMNFNFIGDQAQYEYDDFAASLITLKKSELGDSINLTNFPGIEEFRNYEHKEYFKNEPFQIPQHFKDLFGKVPITVDWEERKGHETKIYINPLIDDRMFVVSWYGNTDLCKELASETKEKRDGFQVLNYETNDWWYKYIFNDQRFATCQDKSMKSKLIQKHTYSRWADYGTFYGINRYSFVCLTDTLDNLKKPYVNAAFLVNHLQTIYYKMAELCLVQRACVLRFSQEVAGISAMKDNKKIPFTKRVSNLYKQYIKFVNRIYFREVTAQEQGIELYDMMQEHMRIEQNVKDLDNEISELNQYATLLEDQKRNNSLAILTLIGSIFIIPTFIVGFYGMNIGPYSEIPENAILPIIAGMVITPFFVVWFIYAKEKKYAFILLFMALICFLTAILLPYLLKT
ncbi:MAG TPA: CorA family divalent cation transporter [Saprospiraceae bacterium]|nr:hypothetical protein [Saprospirales bacterium]HRQ30555.1 CorA family divalent cation transporter [Saprospiraceae bacterium]